MNDVIKRILGSELVPHLDDHNTKHAAVMIVIYDADHKIIMTQKPLHMNQHAGEISFPGGKIDTNDENLLDTAIRETQEEIGLVVSKSDVIGQLKPVQTRNSGYTIIPFVAMLDQITSLQPNSEVDEILHIPIVPLLKTLTDDDDPEHRSLFEAYKLTYGDKLIWGASARMLKQIADIFRHHKII
ncbi:MAG: CoA pyrophosphatase [Candidatus Nitrosotenuis sp.]|jgi:8-oxo-dGTP pyrophosphatase MutT (NUDIX family)